MLGDIIPARTRRHSPEGRVMVLLWHGTVFRAVLRDGVVEVRRVGWIEPVTSMGWVNRRQEGDYTDRHGKDLRNAQ